MHISQTKNKENDKALLIVGAQVAYLNQTL